MHRDLAQIISSVHNAPPGWLRGFEVFASFLGVPSIEIEELERSSLSTKCEFMVEAFKEKARESSGLIKRWLSYNEIVGKFSEVLSDTWGIELTREEGLLASEAFRFDSKSYPERILFDER